MKQALRGPYRRRSPAPTTSGLFLALCRAQGVPEPVPEHRFDPRRRWRIDWAWPDAKIGLEIDGAVWVAGRHTRGSGWLKDTEKLNACALAGFRMLRCTPQQLTDPALWATIKAMLT